MNQIHCVHRSLEKRRSPNAITSDRLSTDEGPRLTVNLSNRSRAQQGEARGGGKN